MSQIAAITSPDYMLIASDRRVSVMRGEESIYTEKRKLFPLGPTAAITTGGAAIGINISEKLSDSVGKTDKVEIEELEGYVLDVFQRRYDEFIDRGAKWFSENPDAHRRSCFLIGGRDSRGSFSLSFYVSENHGEPFTKSPLSSQSLAMPRRLGLEAKLSRALMLNSPLDEVTGLALSSLRQIAEHDEGVGAPFDLALFDSAGMRLERRP